MLSLALPGTGRGEARLMSRQPLVVLLPRPSRLIRPADDTTLAACHGAGRREPADDVRGKYLLMGPTGGGGGRGSGGEKEEGGRYCLLFLST